MTEAKITVRMTDDEAWQMLEQSVTGILTTLRRDGRPVALPIWYAALDRRIYVSTRGMKVVRAKHDSRCSFLVEAGERWSELRSVHLDCVATVITPSPELADRIRAAMAAKYTGYRASTEAMPTVTRQHYARAARATLELVPHGKALTWDNRKLGIG
jgi:hypothetical protein